MKKCFDDRRTTTEGTFDGLISVSTPPSLKWEDLRNKYRYPLAIVIYRTEVPDSSESNCEGSEIVSSVSINIKIYIRNMKCIFFIF